jgi:WD40 repeat protein
MGIYILSAAGYDPASFAKFWDRFAETKGKTGGFFSDLFGLTSPDSKRLKEAIRTAGTLPAACIPAKAIPIMDFAQWQSSVRGFVGRAAPESLHNVVSRAKLDPALRTEVTHLRFSPDGRYILAQDDSGITVLTRIPFSPIFRIPAADAEPASFTPDSSHVVFHTADLRVESWKVSERKLDQAHELILHVNCAVTNLSPDGRTLACFDDAFGLNLFDVATSAPVFQKKSFYTPDLATLFAIISSQGDLSAAGVITMGFSTDGRYFAAGHRNSFAGGDSVLLYDLQTKLPLVPKGNVKKFMANNFVFTGPDRLLAVNPEDAGKSSVVSLPSAEAIGPVFLMNTSLTAATKGNYLFVRPMQRYAVGVLELDKATGTKGLGNEAIDVYDDVFVAERGTGELGLYAFASNQLTAQTTLPSALIGRLRASAVSADLRYLAFSERTRGGVWDLSTGRRIFQMRGFRGAGFDDRNAVAVDVPRFREEVRRIAQIDAATGQGILTVPVRDQQATQHGALVLTRSPLDRDRDPSLGVIIEVKDARTLAPLWKKAFDKETPVIDMDDATERLIIGWPASSVNARAEARRDPELRKRLDALEDTEGDFILQVLDGRTGQLAGTLFVETGKGSFGIIDAHSSGDWVAIRDSQDRTRVYSLSSGELKGRVFGTTPILHGGRSLVAVQNGTRVTVHDAATLKVRDEFTFAHNVAYSAFSRDGARLLVVTTDHTAVVLDVGK